MVITGFSELKKRQKLQEQETLQHQKRTAVSCLNFEFDVKMTQLLSS